MTSTPFGRGIESTKIQYSNKEAAFSDFRQVKIALIGEGRIHGEDDTIAMRPYNASLICSVANSELFVMTRKEFQRIFKQSEAWKNALKHAKSKEKEYIGRCNHYLDINKEVIKLSSKETKPKNKKQK